MRLWNYSGNEKCDQGAHYGAIVAADSNNGEMAQNADGSDQWEAIGHTSGHAIYCILSGTIIAAFSESISGDFYPADVAEEMARRLTEVCETPNSSIPHPSELFRMCAASGDTGGGATYRSTGEPVDTGNNGVALTLPISDFPA